MFCIFGGVKRQVRERAVSGSIPDAIRSKDSNFGSVSAWRLVLGPECGDYHLHSLLKNGLALCFVHSVSAGFVI